MEILASDSDSLPSRLGHPLVQAIVKLDPEDFHEEIRDDFETIQSNLPNTERLSTRQAVATSRLIVSLLENYAKLEVLNLKD